MYSTYSKEMIRDRKYPFLIPNAVQLHMVESNTFHTPENWMTDVIILISSATTHTIFDWNWNQPSLNIMNILKITENVSED